jgi:hypothetical protein
MFTAIQLKAKISFNRHMWALNLLRMPAKAPEVPGVLAVHFAELQNKLLIAGVGGEGQQQH